MRTGSRMPMKTIFTMNPILRLRLRGTSQKKDSRGRSINLLTRITGSFSFKPSRSLINRNHKQRMDISPCPINLNSLKNCCSANKKATIMASIDLISTKEKKQSKNPSKTLLRRITKEASSNLARLSAKIH